MSARRKIEKAASDAGWGVLHTSKRSVEFYKWKSGVTLVRREVHVIFDAAGRVEAVSTWENQRTSIDHEPGRRKRLEALLAPPRPASETGEKP